MGYICSDCKCTEWKGWESCLPLLQTRNNRVLDCEPWEAHLPSLQDGEELHKECKCEHSQPKLRFGFRMNRRNESGFNLRQPKPGLLALSSVLIGDTLLGIVLMDPVNFCGTQQMILCTGDHGLLRARCAFKRPQLMLK